MKWYPINENLEYYCDPTGKVLSNIQKDGVLWRVVKNGRYAGEYISKEFAKRAVEL